jgi:acetoin utilization deacetylase AcuC-like enzyme
MPFALVSAAMVSTMQPLSLYTHPVCIGHEPGMLRLGGHPESPARLSGLLNAMRTEWKPTLGEHLRIHDALEADATREQLLRVHSEAHLDKVNGAFANAERFRFPQGLDGDTVASPGSRAAATRAAGLVVAATDEVFGETSAVQRAFVMVRPPGHHAERDKPMGFCLYNNVMVGVAHARAAHGVRRVAILDFDVHHGNGDAALAVDDENLLYASSHQSPCFPGTGATPGFSGPHGTILSAPLPPGAGSDLFRAAWSGAMWRAVQDFRPEAVFLSAGFDAHAEDPLAGLALVDDDFGWVTEQVTALGVPIVSVLEGGYNVDALCRAARQHVEALIRS